MTAQLVVVGATVVNMALASEVVCAIGVLE